MTDRRRFWKRADAGDIINLSLIDASSINGAGNDAFALSNDGTFHDLAGELRTYERGGNSLVEGDTNGDGNADIIIAVGTADSHQLGAEDFIF